MTAAMQTTASSAPRTSRPVNSRDGVNRTSTVPAGPAGSTHACCQPWARWAGSTLLSSVACQPGLMFCGIDSTVVEERAGTSRDSGIPEPLRFTVAGRSNRGPRPDA